jgi:Mg2+ and Co2+ transporter CorA
MPQLQPMPLFLNESVGADRGLICGYQLQEQGPAREVTAGGIAQPDKVTWLHFNLSDARARRWLLDAAFLPTALREVLQEHDENRHVESIDGGLLLVISDFTYEDESDPSEVAATTPGICARARRSGPRSSSRRCSGGACCEPLSSIDEL